MFDKLNAGTRELLLTKTRTELASSIKVLATRESNFSACSRYVDHILSSAEAEHY
jgi:hypothetical protein